MLMVTVNGTFSWNGSPYIKSQDCAGIAIIGSAARFGQYSSSCTVTYANGTVISNPVNQYFSMLGKAYTFGIADVNGQVFSRCDISYSGVADGTVNVFDYGIGYAHRTVRISVSGSFGLNINAEGSASAGFGISFSAASNYNLEFSGISTHY